MEGLDVGVSLTDRLCGLVIQKNCSETRGLGCTSTIEGFSLKFINASKALNLRTSASGCDIKTKKKKDPKNEANIRFYIHLISPSKNV